LQGLSSRKKECVMIFDQVTYPTDHQGDVI
jgi:hypothetical protein